MATGGQLVAMLGLVWELSHGIDPGKANELRRLGVDPYLRLWVNMVYSSAAFAIFLWALVPLAIKTSARLLTLASQPGGANKRLWRTWRSSPQR